jgi:hypothetical protein
VAALHQDNSLAQQPILISTPGEPIFQQAEQLPPHFIPAAIWMKAAENSKLRATESVFIVVL